MSWRNTVTFEEDVAVRLKRFLRKHDKGFKEGVNEIMRSGLDSLDVPPKKRKPFRIRAFDAGKPLFKSPEELKMLVEDIQEEEDLEKMRRSGF